MATCTVDLVTALAAEAAPKKDKLLKLRVDEGSLRRYADAARRERKTVSAWLRELADRAVAAKEGSAP